MFQPHGWVLGGRTQRGACQLDRLIASAKTEAGMRCDLVERNQSQTRATTSLQCIEMFIVFFHIFCTSMIPQNVQDYTGEEMNIIIMTIIIIIKIIIIIIIIIITTTTTANSIITIIVPPLARTFLCNGRVTEGA